MAYIHVIIPCYNAEKYIEEAVYSVLNQPFKNIDIILVDDGSPGKTPQLCDEIAARESRVYTIHQKNGGVSAARNAGIEYVLHSESKNDTKDIYIAFMDADDAWNDGFMDEHVVGLLSEGYDLIGFQSCECDSMLRKGETPRKLPDGMVIGGEKNVWLHSSQHFAAMFYACQLLSKYGVRFSEGLKYSEDKIFSLQCMYLAEQIYLESRLMYLYRIHSASAMGRRAFGIPYYQPIIEAYLEMDRAMLPWATPERGQLYVGRCCASTYAADMMEEHFQSWRPQKEIDRFWTEHSEYITLMKAQPPYECIPRNRQYEAYENAPKKYILKHNLLGVVKFVRKKLIRIIKRFE